MPEVVEIALFRALQEGLTNTHRHSGSLKVQVKFHRLPKQATLEIKDFGHGIPQPVMDRFQRTGAGSGLGLAGMRERIKELGGDFTIISTDAGTILFASVPLGDHANQNEESQRDIAEKTSTAGSILS
jgi:two-component system NarL family sensor kinase